MTAIATAGVARITPDDVLQMPDGDAYELVGGVLVERNVSIESSEVALSVGSLLRVEVLRTREARVFANDLGYQCFPDDPDRYRRPDGSVVRRDRTTGIRNDRGFMPIPADLVVEVVSPNDTSYDVAEKVQDYLDAGFPLIWVIHPNVRTVTVYRAGEAEATVFGVGDEITAEPALAEFRCRVAAFFE